jgi:hypothetical protein
VGEHRSALARISEWVKEGRISHFSEVQPLLLLIETGGFRRAMREEIRITIRSRSRSRSGGTSEKPEMRFAVQKRAAFFRSKWRGFVL